MQVRKPTRLHMKTYRILILLVGLLAAGTSSAVAQGTPGGPGGPPEVTGPGSERSQAVHALLSSFRERRQEYIAERRQLMLQLQQATEDERKDLLAQLRERQRERIQEQRELARQIREQMKELRKNQPTG
jgi:Skp family chaperone for outer membrane proteins